MANDDKKPGSVAALNKIVKTDPNQAYAQATVQGIHAAFAKDNPASKLKLSATEAIKLRQGLASTEREGGKATFIDELAAAAADKGTASYNFRAGTVAKKPVVVNFDTSTGSLAIVHDGNKYDATLPAVTAPVVAPAASAPASAPGAAPAAAPASAPATKPPSQRASGVVTSEAAAPATSGTDHSATIEANRARDAKARQAAVDAEASAQRQREELARRRTPESPATAAAPAAVAAAAPAAKPPKPAAGGDGGKFDPQVAAAERFLIALGEVMHRGNNSPSWNFHFLVNGVDGIRDQDFVGALQNYQELNGLPKTGKLDKATVTSMQAVMREAGIGEVGAEGVLDAKAMRAMASFDNLSRNVDKIQAAAPRTAADAEHARVQGILDSGGAGFRADVPVEGQETSIMDAFDGLTSHLDRKSRAAAARAPAASVDVDAPAAEGGVDFGKALQNGLSRLREGAAELGTSAGGVVNGLRTGLGDALDAGKAKVGELAEDLEARRKAWEAEQAAKGKKGPVIEP